MNNAVRGETPATSKKCREMRDPIKLLQSIKACRKRLDPVIYYILFNCRGEIENSRLQ
jgi:hypothetical protein